MSEQESGNSKRPKLVMCGLLAAIVVGLGVVIALRGDGSGSAAEKSLMQVRNALALTENVQPEDAIPLWSELLQQFPSDKSIALNRALNHVLMVDTLADQATSPLLEESEKQAAREKLPSEIQGARAALDDFERIAEDPITRLWLASRVDLQEAVLLQAAAASITKSLRGEVFDRLTEALAGEVGKSPESVILGGPLTHVMDQLKDPIDGLPSQLLQQATQSVSALSDQHPDNLYLAIRAAMLQVESKNLAAKDYVDRTAKLAQAIRPLLNDATKPVGLTAEELVGELLTAIEQQSWNDAGTRMLQWFNVLNPTEILKTDRRRASPHPLDRLSFQTLRRLSAEVIADQPIDEGRATLSFNSSQVEQSAGVQAIAVVDFNLDLVDDLAVITDQKLVQLWSMVDSDWTQVGQIELEFQPRGLCVADLFMVDSSHPNRIKTEVASTEDEEEEDYSTSSRHDTFPALVAYGDQGIQLIALDGRESTAIENRMTIVDKPTGLVSARGISKVLTGDLEGDGDLDLIVATQNSGVRLFINRGNRTFFEATGHEGGFDRTERVVDMAIADIDRDLDLDVAVLMDSGKVGVLENLLHLQFRGRVIDEIPAVEASSLFVADIDGNISWDLVLSGEASSVVVFSQTAEAGIWTIERIESAATPMPIARLADFDNDSWLELVATDPGSGRQLRIGPWGMGEPSEIGSLRGISLAVADFDADGLLDIASIDDGKITILINDTQSEGHYIDVRFRGIADNAADSGRVNHFAIGSVLELRFGPHYRSQIITSPSTHFAMGSNAAADTIRVILPNGLTQTIRNPAVDTIVEEEQSLKGSCPYLYCWDGEKFVFMTDCLWAAPLGLQVARGVVAPDRPWEYLKLDGRHVKPRNGHYEFRITEELWEIAYIDKVAVSTVDHPPDVQVWTNEKVGPGEIAKPTVFAFRESELRPLKSAADTNGLSITEKLRRRDRNFVQGFDRRIRQGLCPPHWIDLDFGELAVESTGEVRPSAYLVLTGWILPTDTSLNIQIDQNPELPPIEFPSVWVPDADQPDGWRKAIPFMGFPGGKTKTIVVDVTDVIDWQHPRLRIRTSAQIYWDDANLAVQTKPAPFTQQTTQLASARLTYHGYSARHQAGPKQPETYDYQDAGEAPRWPPLRGSLTQFGDCRQLIDQWDDEMVVMGAGDELRMMFTLPQAPIPDGWKRDFVLHCVGWDKDADLNTLAGQTTGPLPYRKMGQYPPTAASLESSRRVEEKNRPHLQRYQSFRAFWHRGDNFPTKRFLPPSAYGF